MIDLNPFRFHGFVSRFGSDSKLVGWFRFQNTGILKVLEPISIIVSITILNHKRIYSKNYLFCLEFDKLFESI